MRLAEFKPILEYQFPDIKKVNVHKHKHPAAYRSDFGMAADNNLSTAGGGYGVNDPRLLKRNKDVEHLGSGTFASAYTNPKTIPHDVRKISKQQDRHDIDGFFFYMQGLADNPDNTNPYFPRFREIKIYTHEHDEDPPFKDERKDRITYSAQMERLYHLKEMSRTEEDAILAKMLGPDRVTPNDVAQGTIDQILKTTSRPFNGRAMRVIKFLLNEPQKIKDDIVDEDLINATSWLREFSRTSGLRFDIHHENIMYRKTPYGPQMVITDPYSYQS